MFGKILKKDISRNKVITATLFLFIMLASLLVASAVQIITELFGSMDSLFEKAQTTHFAQMHAGEIDQPAIDRFAVGNSGIVKVQQTVKMLNINGANIFLGGGMSEADSVMDNAFVKQNKYFDFLLDTDNQILQLSDGEAAVPIYHMQKYNLQIGDTVKIANGNFSMEFTIVAFARDSLMNPSMLNSKRFLVSDNDWDVLQENLGEIEYLIEFQVYDISRIRELETLYQDADLPQKGPAMAYSLVRLINSLSDGISAAVVILISVLLILIAALCLRFTMMATIEEDYREIGVMKAIGIHSKDIRGLYLTKYVVTAATASICGYVLSLLVGGVFTRNIALYMGGGEKSIWNGILPLVGSALVFGAVVALCRLVLRRFKRISAVEALRPAGVNGNGKIARGIRLHRSGAPNVNVFLGAREVLARFKTYGILCFIFIICSFLMVVPINFLNTLTSPEFVTYMGSGQCDVRIDLQQTGDMAARYDDMAAYIRNDPDIEKHSALFTSTFKARGSDGEYGNIKVEIGDFSIFPLPYTNGSAPELENEIALSSMNADELRKGVGDTLSVLVNGEERELTVCGIYQDVTNGGKTAKAVLPYDADNIIWFTVNLNVKAGVDIDSKLEEYGTAFYPAKATDVNEYIYQTLGGVIDQLNLVVKFAFGLAVAIAILITAMFFKMLIAKEASEIAIMRSLGISCRGIRLQYITRGILVLLAGIAIGGTIAVPLGQELAGMLISGVSSMRFIISPLMGFIVCPLTLAATVGITVFFTSASIKRINTMLVAE